MGTPFTSPKYLTPTLVEMRKLRFFDATKVIDGSTRPNARVGFQITEEIVTPESDTSLLDNATGTSNFAAKGAHRLKINLTLTSKEIDSSDDADFVEIMRIVDDGISPPSMDGDDTVMSNSSTK